MRFPLKTQTERDELLATSMLVGDHPPKLCYACGGSGSIPSFTGNTRCRDCSGMGYGFIGRRTREAIGLRDEDYFVDAKSLRNVVEKYCEAQQR